jgi:hypothetical protein
MARFELREYGCVDRRLGGEPRMDHRMSPPPRGFRPTDLDLAAGTAGRRVDQKSTCVPADIEHRDVAAYKVLTISAAVARQFLVTHSAGAVRAGAKLIRPALSDLMKAY